MRNRDFPRSGFLLLGVMSLAAAGIFVVRALVVEATGERVVSTIAFALMGVLWLAAYIAARRAE